MYWQNGDTFNDHIEFFFSLHLSFVLKHCCGSCFQYIHHFTCCQRQPEVSHITKPLRWSRLIAASIISTTITKCTNKQTGNSQCPAREEARVPDTGKGKSSFQFYSSEPKVISIFFIFDLWDLEKTVLMWVIRMISYLEHQNTSTYKWHHNWSLQEALE